jgi:hypothetical protein
MNRRGQEVLQTTRRWSPGAAVEVLISPSRLAGLLGYMSCSEVSIIVAAGKKAPGHDEAAPQYAAAS